MSIIYEITATVATDIADRFERFMRDEHIPAVVAAGSFVRATFSRSANSGRYRISYEAVDRADLAKYLEDHAPRLRALTLQAFPSGVEFVREEWEILGVVEGTADGVRPKFVA